MVQGAISLLLVVLVVAAKWGSDRYELDNCLLNVI